MATIENLLSKMVDKINDSVKIESQSFTDNQKSQVRQNIGAPSIDDLDEIAMYIMSDQVLSNLIPVLQWDGQINNRPIWNNQGFKMVKVSNEVIYDKTQREDLTFILKGIQAPGTFITMTAYPQQDHDGCGWLIWDGDEPLKHLMYCAYEDQYDIYGNFVQKGTYLCSASNAVDLGELDSTYAGLESYIHGFYVAAVLCGDYTIPSTNIMANSITYNKYPFTVNKNVLEWDGTTVLDTETYTKNGKEYKYIYDDVNRIYDLCKHTDWATYIMADGSAIIEDYQSNQDTEYFIIVNRGISDGGWRTGLYIHPDVRKIISSANIESYLFEQIGSNHYNDVEKYMNDNTEVLLSSPLTISYPSEDADIIAWDEATSFTLDGNLLQLELNEIYTIEIDGMARVFRTQFYDNGGNTALYIGNREILEMDVKENFTTNFPVCVGYIPDIDGTFFMWSRSLPPGKHNATIYKGAKQFNSSYIPMRKLIDENIDYIYEKILERTEQLKNS